MGNPNWPYIDEAVSFPSNVQDTQFPFPYHPFWVSLAPRSIHSNTTKRGKQYELDQVQSGEYHPIYDNRDGVLSPVNTASPYYPNVTPFRPIRKRAQWPATQNMCSNEQANAGEVYASGTKLAAAPKCMVDNWADANASVQTAAGSVTGSKVLQGVVPSSSAAGTQTWHVFGYTVMPGKAHTFSTSIRSSGASQTLSVSLQMWWIDVNGNQITSTTGSPVTLATSGAWQTPTVTSTPPANAAGGYVLVVTNTVPTVAVTTQIDALQLEYAAAATAWVQPNWYSLFTGWVERWPLTWDGAGLFSTVEPVCVDGFAVLSQQMVKPPFYNDIASTSPAFFYPMDESQGATQFSDLTGNVPPAPLVNAPYGAGSAVAGGSLQTTTQSALPLGTSQVCLTLNSGTSRAQDITYGTLGTYLDLSGAGGEYMPTHAWTRCIAFRTSQAAITDGTSDVVGTLFDMLDIPSACEVQVGVSFHPAGPPGMLFIQTHDSYANAYQSANIAPRALNDGNWHFLILTYEATGTGKFTAYIDGNTYTFSPTSILPHATMGLETVGMGEIFPYYGSGPWPGDIQAYGGWQRALTINEKSFLYVSWKTAWAGYDSSFQRYTRILNYAGYKGLTQFIGTPGTGAIGPASDIAQGWGARGSGQNGIDALSAMGNAVVTENGNHFVSADGLSTFESRTNRYGVFTPAAIFGEHDSAGEIPYATVSFDYDTTHVANDSVITQWKDSATTEAMNTTSQLAMGTRSLQRTVNTQYFVEAIDASYYYVARYGTADLRVQKIQLHPSANPSSFGTLLALELGSRVRVMRRPPGFPAIQWDGFVESIAWTMDDQGTAVVDLEVSPLAPTKVPSFMPSAMHTTLNAGVSAGATSIVLNALSTAATHAFTEYVSSGLKLRIGAGSGTWEEIAVSSVTGGAVGYSTVTVTLASALANSYPSGATVSEALPAIANNVPGWDDANAIVETTTVVGY